MINENFAPLILNVGKAVHHADWNWQNVCSPFARIYYIVSGSAMVFMNDECIKLRPSRMYFIPPFMNHSLQCDGDFIHYYIHIYEDSPNGSGLMDEYDLPHEIESMPGDEMLFERLLELNPSMSLPQSDPQKYDNDKTLRQSIAQNKQQDEWLRMESRGIVYQICSRFLYYATPKSYLRESRIYNTLQYIHQNLTHETSTEKLASMVFLSPEHFIRLFTKTIGVTPMQYFNQKRIEKSQLMLLTTNDTVKQIAFSLGYKDDSYFVRVFKRVTGTTPLDYRKQRL